MDGNRGVISMGEGFRNLKEKLSGFRYVLLMAAVGLLLLALSGGDHDRSSGVTSEEEARVEAILTQILGVGEAELLLSENGAVVVCEGADSAGVCLRITQALRCYTGLGADKVQIFKMK